MPPSCTPTPRPDARASGNASREADFALRARLRKVTEHPRERLCGVACVGNHATVVAKGHPGAWSAKWRNVLTCGHIWTCPVCSLRIRGERLQRVLRAVSNAGGRWQMLTPTIRHEAHMPLRRTLRGLLRAWRRVRQGGPIQATWTARVACSVRSIDATWSRRAGWHPHLHVMLRTSEWTDEERDELLARWKVAVRRELGDECVPDDEHGLHWADPFDLCAGEDLDAINDRRTRYMFKLGLEVVGSNKRGHGRSETPWQIAERAAAGGDSEAVDLWREYAAATRGHQLVKMDARMQRFALARGPDASMLFDETFHAEEPDPSTIQTIECTVTKAELRELGEFERSRDQAIFAVILNDVATSQRPRVVVEKWLEIIAGRPPDPLDECSSFPVSPVCAYTSSLGGRSRSPPLPDDHPYAVGFDTS